MHTSRLLLASLVAVPVAFVVLPTSPAAPAYAAPASPALAAVGPALAPVGTALALAPTPAIVFGYAPDRAFKEKFQKALEKNVKADLERLVKTESGNASAWIARAHEILAARPDDPEMVPLLAGLSTAWAGAMKSTFPDKQKDFFAGLAGQNKKDRVDLRQRFDQKMGEFTQNSEKKDGWVFAQLADEFELLASSFDQVGDHYFASEAWITYAACYDEPLRGQAADVKRALGGLEKALAERAKVDLADSIRDEVEKRRALLAGRGSDKPAPESGPGQGPSDAGATVDVPLTFEVVPTVDAFLRPTYTADDLVVVWRGIPLKGNGSQGAFETLAEAPILHRLGSADLRFDMDRDGKGDGPADLRVPMTGNITPVTINLGKGANARPWAFLAAIGNETDTYQGIQMNMAPVGNVMTLYTQNASSVVGNLAGTPIRILDDSLDGLYGSTPLTYQFAGITKGYYQPELDCIVVGASKRARPWSEIQEVGGKWWKFEMASPGKSIKASPIRTDTGFLKLEYKGGVAPTWLVVKGANEMKDSYFDLAEAGAKGLEVPIGRYTLYYGEVRKGKKKQVQKTIVLPGKNSQNYDVTKGNTTVITLGAPFTLDFAYRVEEDKVVVTGQSVVVVGSAGERYERPWSCVPKVEAGFRKKGTKKAGKYDKMPMIQDNEGIVKLGWDAVWFPLDLSLDVKGQGEVEVQIVDKKHDLFGKLESEWK